MRWYEHVFSVKNISAAENINQAETVLKQITVCGIKLRIQKKRKKYLGRSIEDREIELYNSENSPKRLLIIKLDSMGDYVLIRNFWKEVKNSEKYKGAHITLVLSTAVQKMAELLDSDDVDELFFIKYKCWQDGPDALRAEFDKLLDENKLKDFYDAIIFPTFSHCANHDINRYLISRIYAKETILNNGDMELDDGGAQKLNYMYTRVVPTDYNAFEFFTNRRFFEEVLEREIPIPMHFISPEKLPPRKIAEDYIVINPCSQDAHRNWHPHNFAELIRLLSAEYGKKIIVCGAPKEAEYCGRIRALAGGLCEVSTDNTTEEFLSLLKHAGLFVGLDSGGFHMAVSLGTKSVMITGGISFFRFVNYPESPQYRIVIHPKTKERLMQNVDGYTRAGRNYFRLGAGVNAVSVRAVKDAADSLLKR